jgi:hypothetical protein
MSQQQGTGTTTRTQAEIVARLAASDGMFGFDREVLIGALDFEHAKPYLNAEVTEDQWFEDGRGERNVLSDAMAYLGFAIDKILNHRGISASRSVEKLREYAWLLGRDDVVAAMDEADYAQYGAPQVKAFAVGMGLTWPDIPDLARMANGEPCEPGCESGCGR